MPRIAANNKDPLCDTRAEASKGGCKPLFSLVDEIAGVLSTIGSEMHYSTQAVPSVQAWINAYNHAGLDWSALPEAVDSSSTGMGLSTKKSEKQRAKKLQKLDPDKVNARALRKRQQVESFLAVLQPLVHAAGSTSSATSPPPAAPSAASPMCMLQQQEQQLQQQPPALHIVDFGCGTGNLLLPLAALFPWCTFTGVDMKPAALQLLQQRAAAAGLVNVRAFEGMVELFSQPFDVALALHACGNATDYVLQMAVDQEAAFIVSPCCIGKLKFSMSGGSSFNSKPIMWTPTQPGDAPAARKQQLQLQRQEQQQESMQPAGRTSPQQLLDACNQQQQQSHQVPGAVQQQAAQQDQGQQLQPACRPTPPQQQEADADAAVRLQHPRSQWLRSSLPEPERHFRIMARVADIAHTPADQALLGAALAQRAAVADSCKRFVELDRCAAAAEAGYAVGLFKVLGAETMTKNDLLVGLPATGAAAAAAVDTGATGGDLQRCSNGLACGTAAAVERWSCCRDFVEQGLLLTAAELGVEKNINSPDGKTS